MTLWNKSELLEALSSQLLEHNLSENLSIEEVLIDSRKINKSGLFIAIKGEKNDGHDYLEQTFANGSAVALIDNKTKLPQGKNYQFLLVKNSFDAMYDLAHFSRKRSAAKIIAVTGSVGKTSTKEMLRDAFSTCDKTFATLGNLNNHFGVPLSLCNFSADCEFGIFEMGMNHLNEIEPLSRLVQSHLAIITNVGPAHIENFKNEQEIALAKSEIFRGVVTGGKVLINRDNKHFEFLQDQANQHFASNQIITFGKENSSDYQIISEKILEANLAEVAAKLNNDAKISYQISSSHTAAIFNSIITVAALDLLQADLAKGVKTLEHLHTPAGRGKISDVKFENKNITIIDDTYNASLLSIESGTKHAANLKKALHKKRLIVALGDMLELGKNSVELHEMAVEFAQKFGADLAILVGKEMSAAGEKKLSISHKTFVDSMAASLDISALIDDGDLLYIKGSRGLKMEKLIEKIAPQILQNSH
jgi:UDP-N-acetylmuramoyl-tripeptide--D-alanyl-D-alanine ligase